MTDERDAVQTAAAVQAGAISATDVCAAPLELARSRAELNCFSELLPERAAAQAAAVDEAVGADRDPGPLSGVPFAIKDLFDVRGVSTRAGSRLNADRPSDRDATAVALLMSAGAVPIGTTVMDEFAYGFTSENEHYGAVHNPLDPARMAGGSSGGSAAAVAAGIVPLALGSDTNGSIRVPAALCGVLGLRPTYGAIAAHGMHPFAPSFDQAGILARSARDLWLAFDLLTGNTGRRRDLGEGHVGLRIGVADGYFRRGAHPEVIERLDAVATRLGAIDLVELDGVKEARAAAIVITAAEGAQLHLDELRTRAAEFDRMTRCGSSPVRSFLPRTTSLPSATEAGSGIGSRARSRTSMCCWRRARRFRRH